MVDEFDSQALVDLFPRAEDAGIGHALTRDRAKARLFGHAPMSHIGRFEVERPLGRGGMGEVHLANDPELHRPVAIKLVHAALLADSDSRGHERALREAQALAQVSHPNVIEVFEVGEHEGRPFVAMEYVEGWTLEQWLRETQPGWRELVEVFIDAGRGLAAVHRAGLIHRDFKPDNVLISESEGERRVRVLDFGLARLTSAEVTELGATEPDFQLTAAGAILGTPAFMPLEQLRGQTLSDAADQFAFCVTLYRALWGDDPFTGNTIDARIEQLARNLPREPSSQASVPRRLWPIVRRGLAREPDERWPGFVTLLAELERTVRPKRRWPWLVVTTVGAMLGASLAVFSGLSTVQEPRAHAAVDPCASLSAKARALWDPTLSALAEAQYAKLERPYSAHTFARVDAGMRRWYTTWLERRAGICTTSQMSTFDPLEQLRLERRARCLDELYVEVDALSRALREVDESTLELAAEMLDELPALEPCTDDAYLEQGALLAPKEQRAEVNQARTVLAELRVQRRRGHLVLAEAGFTHLQERVAPLTYAPLKAELASEAAKLALGHSRRPEALEQLAAAAVLAEQARLDRLAAHDWTVLALQAVIMQRDAERGRRWLERAEVQAMRLGQPPELGARLQCIHGALAGMEGDLERARELLDEALSRFEGLARTGGIIHRWTPTCLEARARVVEVDHEALAWLELALAAALEIYGPDHPKLEGFRMALTATKQRLGELDDELEFGVLSSVIASLEAHHINEARVLIESLATKIAEEYGPDNPYFAQVETLRGSLEFQAGNHSEALAQFDRARARLADDLQMRPFVLELDYNRGACLFALQQLEQAEAVYADYATAVPEPPHSGEAHALLAQLALARGHHDKVSTQLALARARLGDEPSERFDVVMTEILLELRPEAGDRANCAVLRERLAAATRGLDQREQAIRIELTLAAIDASASERRCLGWSPPTP